MKKKDIEHLYNGVYRIFWKKSSGGGYSLASLGRTHDGTVWFSPSNWTSENNDNPKVSTTDWSSVKKVELIEKRW